VVGQQPLEFLDVGRDLGIDDSGLHAPSQPNLTVIINFCDFLVLGGWQRSIFHIPYETSGVVLGCRLEARAGATEGDRGRPGTTGDDRGERPFCQSGPARPGSALAARRPVVACASLPRGQGI
jgi:hypothetical protein